MVRNEFGFNSVAERCKQSAPGRCSSKPLARQAFFPPRVSRGKGAKDRYVPLPPDTFALLRRYWTTHRHPPWLFPATGRTHKHMTTATEPMNRSSVQGAFRKAQQRAGITKRAVGIHTLRHCYATPLLEAGVNLRAIQRYMGHARLETTMMYLHLTHKGHEDAVQRINTVMRGLPS